jgi:hypothetical protein
MKTLYGIAVVGLVLLGPAGHWAEAARDPHDYDGNKLLELCRDAIRVDDAGGRGSAQVTYNAGYCTGVVDGMLDMHAEYTDESLLLSHIFCLPKEGIRVLQGVRVVVHYLETHPERLHLKQRNLLIEAFPCAPAASRPQR